MKVLVGDLFKSQAQTWVNTVNCVGVMGKGVALEFKKRFPEMFKDYLVRCKNNEIRVGRPYLFRQLTPPWILNFPTKEHWRSVSRLEDIVKGLEYLQSKYKEWRIESLAVPPLGCGQGQLEWRVVGPTLYRYLAQLDIPVELYAPYGTPHEELRPEFLSEPKESDNKRHEERIKPAWVALVEIVHRLEQEPYHWPVGRLMFQKIAYVATLEDLPTGLEYRKGSFGPFSPDVKKLITKLVNNGLIVEERLGPMFSVKAGNTFPDARRVYRDYLEKWEQKIENITDLFMRLNTAQSEVVATVLFAANSLLEREEPTESDLLNQVMKWKQRRKPPLNETEVATTIRNLAALDWLKVKSSEDLPLAEEELVI